MTVSYRDGIAILQLVFFVPALFLAVLLCVRHGFGRNAGWLFLVVFSLTRILGSSFYLAANNQPRTSWLYVAAAVCSSIGLGPLVLLCVGLVSRVNDGLQRAGKSIVPSITFRLIAMTALIGLILLIVGNTNSSGAITGHGSISTLSKAGTVLFLLVLIALAVVWALCLVRKPYIQHDEKRILLIVGLSLPLLLVRMIYSLIYIFSGDVKFSSIIGSPTIYLCVDVLMEILVILIAMSIGLTLRVIPKEELRSHQPAPGAFDTEARADTRPGEGPYKYPMEPKQPTAGNIPYEHGRRSRRRRGPISMLIGLISDRVQRN